MYLIKTRKREYDMGQLVKGMILWLLLLLSGGFLTAIQTLRYVVTIVLFFLFVIRTVFIRQRLPRKMVMALIMCYAYMAFIFTLHASEAYANQCLNILLLLTIVFFFNNEFMDSKEFMMLYVKVLYLMCIYSLAIYGLNFIFNFTATAPKLGLVSGMPIYILFMGQNVRTFERNAGPFWEPGVFQIFISIALVFTLLFLNQGRKRMRYQIVFIITMLTTVSTAGYLLMAGILMFKLISVVKNLESGKLRLFAWCFVPILLLVMAAVVISTPAVADKFQEDNWSYIRRMADIEVAWPIICNSGPFGKGAANSAARLGMMIDFSIAYNGGGNSIAYSDIASIYGWVTLLLFLIVVLCNTKKYFNQYWYILYGVFIISWATESFMNSPLFYFFFVGFGWNRLKDPRKPERLQFILMKGTDSSKNAI